MDSEVLRLVAGIIGELFTMMMFASPVNTLRKMIKKKSPGEFSAIPYAIAMLNCLVYIWYSTPFVSKGWSNILLLILNSSGLVLIVCFVSIFLMYAPPSSKESMLRLLAGIITFFVALVLVSLFAVPDIKRRRLVVGTTGLIVGVTLNASPFAAIVQVVRTKSVELMSISFSIFSTLSCSSWLAYGALDKDVSIMASNLVGMILGVVQIIMYMIYHSKGDNLRKGLETNDSDNHQVVEMEYVVPNESHEITVGKDTNVQNKQRQILVRQSPKIITSKEAP